MTPEAAAKALLWLAEMGADEAIAETAIDRFSAPVSPHPLQTLAKSVSPPAQAMSAPPRVQNGGSGGDAATLAAACETLDDIVHVLSTFDQCPLKKTATNLCFADGNPNAHVMLVGEAPGRDEDIAGFPFVGRSGQLLDRMLAAIGLSRKAEEPEKSVYITNTIFWRPPGNRDPTDAETTMCLPFLRRAIEIKRPHVIVCVGKIPSQRLTGKTDGILKLRGKWMEYRAGDIAIPLLPTLHPAYLLRQPAQKQLAWRDLLLLKQVLESR